MFEYISLFIIFTNRWICGIKYKNFGTLKRIFQYKIHVFIFTSKREKD